MATNNPQKNYDFALEIDGIEVANIQSVTPPPVELQEHKHGRGGNKTDRKTPGRKTVGDLVCEVVLDQENGDKATYDKIELARTEKREVYAGVAYLVEKDGLGQTVNRFFLDETWIKKVESSPLDTRDENSGNLMRTVTYSVGDYLPV